MYQEELKFLETIIKNAYKKCIKNKERKVEIKENKMFSCDCVTDCDLKTEKFITDAIKKNYPNDTIVSEEYNSTNEMKGRCWILDPIDGTVNFSNNINAWCLQAAFVVDGETKGAVIYCPELNEIYVADENKLTINGKIAKPIINKPINQSIVNFSDFVQKDKKVYDLQLKTIYEIGKKIHRPKMFGSAGYEFCMAASGRIQSYIIFSNNPWDIIPGSYICKIAGLDILHSKAYDTNIVIACTKNLINSYKEVLNIK